jgi:general stress protein 26
MADVVYSKQGGKDIITVDGTEYDAADYWYDPTAGEIKKRGSDYLSEALSKLGGRIVEDITRQPPKPTKEQIEQQKRSAPALAFPADRDEKPEEPTKDEQPYWPGKFVSTPDIKAMQRAEAAKRRATEAEIIAPPTDTERSREQELMDQYNRLWKVSEEGPNRGELVEDLGKIKEQYEEEKKRIGYTKALEMLANSIGKIGTAYYGMKKKVAMPKFEGVDLETNQALDTAHKEYQMEFNRLSDAIKRKDREAYQQHRDAVSQKSRMMMAELQNIWKQQSKSKDIAEEKRKQALANLKLINEAKSEFMFIDEAELEGDDRVKAIKKARDKVNTALLNSGIQDPNLYTATISKERPSSWLFGLVSSKREATGKEMAGAVSELESQFMRGAQSTGNLRRDPQGHLYRKRPDGNWELVTK